MADTQLIIKSDSWKIKIALGLGGLVVIVILAFLYRLEFGLILLATGGIVTVRLFWWSKHKYHLGKLELRQIEAKTRLTELEADKAYWLVIQQKAIAAKLVTEASFVEQKAGTFVLGNVRYAFYPSASASASLAEPLALPSPKLDFFEVMSEPQQAYAIVGPQRIGKTMLAQHLAKHLTRQGVTCLVVGTKAQPGEWLNCRRFIGTEQVTFALASLLAEVKSRIATATNTPPLAVFLDDWLNTVALDANLAEQFFLEAATRILTAGIVPYFLLQSDSKADWGTRHGAQLKNNFAHLLLSAPRVNGGRLDYDNIRASIIYPGERERHAVSLPSGLPEFGEGEVEIELASPQVSQQEQKILEMAENGASMNAIAKEVYGSIGGKQNRLINEILIKNGKK